MSHPPSPDRITLCALLGLLVCIAAVYAGGLAGGFVFDDYPNIVDNAALHVGWNSDWHAWLAAAFSSPSQELVRPLAMLSFAFNHATFGLDPWWMKLTNVAVHLLNTCLAYALARRLFAVIYAIDTVRCNRIALWVAAIWALNPINLMAILFVVQRMESLSHTFVFLGLCLYMDGRQHLIAQGKGWTRLLTGLVGCTAMGLTVKESAALLPLYALCVEWILFGFRGFDSRRDWRLWIMYLPGLVLPGLLGMAWLLPGLLRGGHYPGRDFGLVERLMTESRVVMDYLHWTLLPDMGQLSLYHDDYPVSRGLLSPPSTAVSLIAITVLLLAAWRSRRRWPLAALGMLWFFCAQLLTATVIPLELVYEHRNYFASFGLCLVLGDVLRHVAGKDSMRRAVWLMALLLLILYGAFTALRAREWSNPLRFSMAEATKHPTSPRATFGLARDLAVLSGYQIDSPYLAPALAALERAMQVDGATPLPATTAIILANRSGSPVDVRWWNNLRERLHTNPPGPQPRGALGSLVDCGLQRHCSLPTQEMDAVFTAALSHGRDPEILNIQGNYALNGLGNPTLAAQLWEEAARLAPRVAEYQITLAKLYAASGQPERARAHIEHLRHLGRLGQNEEAARALERLVEQKSATHPQFDRR
ncbi:hypothetical protein J5837_08790 [Pseudoxanthomonas helianthi]|uniref:Tetratricopeptide repeat protein n=1 Tax=Pseudoxanthomonas helianthi TaxID=1453541 RepID=A0A941ATW1_9GAMM|nr:hypothetical protein [Pseudoxanthomonas helianthi]MBP3984524.1 hypothetical protein [Pseudoxanthomonas helianthi]